MRFSERLQLARTFDVWDEQNNIENTPKNFLVFLEICGYLKDDISDIMNNTEDK